MGRPMRKKNVLITVAATLSAVLAGGVLVAAAVVYGGLYNVAASEQHLQPTFTVMATAMRQSVRLRSRGIEAPPLDDEGMVLRGAACFVATPHHCTHHTVTRCRRPRVRACRR